MELTVRNTQGEVVGTVEVSDGLLGLPMNQAVVHQVMVAQRANARQGTAATKIRSQVAGGGAKPRPQKGTGRARQGSIRAPQWRGGGIVFGPHPRSYRQRTPKRVKRLALKVLLSDKAREEQLIVLQELAFDQPRTKEMIRVLDNLDVEPSALIVTKETEPNVVKSAHNLRRIKILPAPLLNVLDLLNHQKLVMTVDALRKAEELWAGEFVRSRKGKESIPAQG